MAGNKNSGRKPKHNATRTSVLLDNEVYTYLKRTGNASAEIERIARKEMEENEHETGAQLEAGIKKI